MIGPALRVANADAENSVKIVAEMQHILVGYDDDDASIGTQTYPNHYIMH